MASATLSRGMLSVEEARARIVGLPHLTGVERVSLDRCAGRVLAEHRLRAVADVPPFTNSAMDGFAVRAADLPGELEVVGVVAAGAPMPPPLAPATAVRIMTGAPIPDGADAIVPLEEAQVRDGRVAVETKPARGRHVRAAGHDTRAGEEVLMPVEPLGPAGIAVLASLGLAEVDVRRRPRVAILSTGDELTPPGVELAPGRIYDANGTSLAAAVAEAGGEALRPEQVGDDAEQTEARITEGIRAADLLVVSGGVSVGERDHVRRAIEQRGSLDFWRIRVQPGKPLAFGEVSGRPVIGLPGNPVSALVTFELFVRPLIRAMLGLAGDGRPRVVATLAGPIPKSPERRAYLRVRVSYGRDGYVAASAGGQASSQLRALAAANALLVVPEGEPEARAGQRYEAILIGTLE
jgi:molybdopterin molybdotransferase